MQQHWISLKEFQEAGADSKVLKRYDRTKYLKLPKIDFYQLSVNYVTQQLEVANPNRDIPNADKGAKLTQAVVKTTDLTMETQTIQVDDKERSTFSEATRQPTYLYCNPQYKRV